MRISPKKDTQLDFTQFTDLSFGKEGVDINWCSSEFLSYQLASDADLSKPTAALLLKHSVLPNLLVELKLLEDNQVKIRMNYEVQPGDAKVPYEPNFDMVENEVSTSPLSDFVRVKNNPFSIEVGYLPQPVLSTTQLAFSQYFTRHGLTLNVDPTTKGLWGLGDHYSEDIFIPDGVYSQWNRDFPDPPLTGQFPSENTYGTHPFFMFKA